MAQAVYTPMICITLRWGTRITAYTVVGLHMDWDVYIPQKMTGSISMDTEIRNVSGVEQSSPMLVLDVPYPLMDYMNYEKIYPWCPTKGFLFLPIPKDWK